MSSSPSPFAEPAYDPPQRAPQGNTVAIVGIIAGTLLLMFCGALGLGYYAVNRLADQWDVFDSSEQDDAFAVQFAIEETPEIQQRVGQVLRVEFDSDLTYDADADYEDYYFRVHGSEGEALVAVRYAYAEHRWFSSVQIVDGQHCRDPHRDLTARPVPFDSPSSQLVYEVLAAEQDLSSEAPQQDDIRWVEYDYEKSLQQDDVGELTFVIHTKEDSQTVLARFRDEDYSKIDSLHRIGSDGKLAETIYQAAKQTEASEQPEVTDPPIESADTESAATVEPEID